MTLKSVTASNCARGMTVTGVTGVGNIANGASPVTFTADKVTGETFTFGRGAGAATGSTIIVELTYTVNA